MKPNKFWLFLLLAASGIAQTLTGNIAPVQTEGLHAMRLPREIRSHSLPDVRDLRIHDSNGNEVPYFIDDGTGKNTSEKFVEYPIVERTATDKSSSYVIDVGGRKLYGLSLTINNSDTEKQYNLSGSNDRKRWFGILNRNLLGRTADDSRPTVTTNISFPLSAYRYLKLTFNDSLSLPIHLVRAGTMKVEPASRDEISFNPKSIEIKQLKKSKQTVIAVKFVNREMVDRIMFLIKSPKYYRRQVTVYQIATRKYRRKNQEYEKVLCEFELRSDAVPFVDVPEFCEKEFFIRIDNRDNPPLEIAQIAFSQNALFAVADLKPGENYTLSTGDVKRDFPDYDLSQLDVDVRALPVADIVNLQPTVRVKPDAEPLRFWQKSWFLWTCIGVGALVILYFTASLVKDMKRG